MKRGSVASMMQVPLPLPCSPFCSFLHLLSTFHHCYPQPAHLPCTQHHPPAILGPISDLYEFLPFQQQLLFCARSSIGEGLALASSDWASMIISSTFALEVACSSFPFYLNTYCFSLRTCFRAFAVAAS